MLVWSSKEGGRPILYQERGLKEDPLYQNDAVAGC